MATITTDENGEATAELLWFQKYVIVEQQAASGYELEDAVGSGTHMQKIQVTGAGGGDRNCQRLSWLASETFLKLQRSQQKRL